jgi:general secretion pathway protein I
MKARGFTLLEVMVAISILGLGLSVILGSQAGLFASANHAGHITYAVSLARCKMSETELDLLKEGYPLVDQSYSGRCCEEDDSEYNCDWRVETIELPQPTEFLPGEEDGGIPSDDDTGLGPLGAIAGLSGAPAAGEPGANPLGALASLGGGDAPGGGIGAMVMGLVYPDLKPTLEASIRKITVAVHWREGKSERDLQVIQYVTDPQQGGLLLSADVPPEADEP